MVKPGVVDIVQEIRGKQVLAYAFMPGIIPRIRSFAESGFGWLAFLMAAIYNAVRLLPNGHPYLDPANRGKYGIRHVIAQAANNLKMTRSNIDQIVIFFALLVGFIILVLQFVLLAMGLVLQTAHAAGPTFGGGMFSTPAPDNDIAFILLHTVLGVPGMFGSYASTPFHIAMHGLFQFYSLAMLIVAVIVVLYYVLVIVGETAQTGTPFGKRFNHIWAPIRLVVALGLLVPIANGLNSGQYITLYAAKLGSGLATNGWLLFNESLTNGLGTSDESLVARPSIPDTAAIVKFMALARTCKESYERVLNNQGNSGNVVFTIEPYLVKNPLINQQIPTNSAGFYQTALQFYKNNDIIISFGAADPTGGRMNFNQNTGGIKPYCGEVVIRTNAVTQVGALEVQEGYFNMIMFLWQNPRIADFAEVMAYKKLPNSQGGCTLNTSNADINCNDGVRAPFIDQLIRDMHDQFDATVTDARNNMIAAGGFSVPPEVLIKGWGGAGIWYNSIAQMNGALFSAAFNLPSPNRLPVPMQTISESRRMHDENLGGNEYFAPHQSDGNAIEFEDPNDYLVAEVLYYAFKVWGEDGIYMDSDVTPKNNIILDTLNFLFGTDGLFSMRENKDIHPLAQLVGIGKGIVDSTVRNLFAATIFSVGGGLFEKIPQFAGMGAFLNVASGMLVSLATVGLTVGFILYYVLPFLPFIYFFFAVGTWLKSVFEAMVGVPLWALAHLKIDGHGLPGDMAMSGYFMIFEIFIRPILTVFGLLASIVIFSAMVRVLNEIFPLVTDNLTGFDGTDAGATLFGGTPLEFKRSVIDEFFFTVVYTIVVYMIATSCFKMIDLVPKSILRWMGSGVQGFADAQGDAKEGLVQYAAMGGMTMSGQLAGTLTSGGRLAGNAAGTVIGNIGPGGGGGSRITGGGGTP